MVGTKVCLKVTKILPFGCILGEEEVLLPKKYVPNEIKIGDEIEVFVYTDSEDRIIATTLEPYGILGEIVCLEVVSVEDFGIFLDLGIAKDIFMPCQNPRKYKIGQKVTVEITQDKQGRLLASQGAKFRKYRGKPYVELDVIPYRKSPLGFECIVEKKYQGMLFANEVFESLEFGKSYRAQVKKTRSDGKIDLKLKVQNQEEKLLDLLAKNGGRIEITKESDPWEIIAQCQMSKKAFKRVLNALVQIVGQDENGIYLL